MPIIVTASSYQSPATPFVINRARNTSTALRKECDSREDTRERRRDGHAKRARTVGTSGTSRAGGRPRASASS